MKKRRKSNRRKLLRKIKVGGQEYKWLVSDNDCDGDGSNRVKVWQGRGLLIDGLRNGSIPITPKYIRAMIEEYLNQRFEASFL